MKFLRFMQCVSLITLLVAPIVSIGTVIVGLAFYILIDDHEAALWICAIAFLVSVVLAPIAATVFSQPVSDTASLSASGGKRSHCGTRVETEGGEAIEKS